MLLRLPGAASVGIGARWVGGTGGGYRVGRVQGWVDGYLAWVLYTSLAGP